MTVHNSCLCLSTPTSGTGSLWRILTAIGRNEYKTTKISEEFERAGRGSELAHWRPEDTGFLYLYNTPHIVNVHITNPKTKIILNFRDPRDLACNQYHWVFQHPSTRSPKEIEEYHRQVREAGIDQFALKSENSALFRSIKALIPRIEAADPNILVLSYNQLCLDFDPMIQRIAQFLEVDPSSLPWDALNLERTEKLQHNPSWIGQIWAGTDTLPGRYKRELRPETVSALDKHYAGDLKMLRSIEQLKFRHLLATGAEEEEMNRVLVGERNYLFLTRDANDTVGQITGKKKLTQTEIFNIAFSHYARRTFGKALATFDYGHAVIPSKEVALKAFLPTEVKFEEDGPRPIGQYSSSASVIWQPFYHPELLDMTSPNQACYPLSDSHWNHSGALRYLQAFLGSVDPSLSVALDKIELRRFQAMQQGDLGLKLELKPESIEIVSPKQSQTRLVFENKVINEGSIRWFKSRLKTGKRAFVMHDSFTMWLFGLLPEIFDEVIFFHGTIFDFDFIRQFNPTTVLCLQAERFFVRIPETGGDMLAFISQQESQKKAEHSFLSFWNSRDLNGGEKS